MLLQKITRQHPIRRIRNSSLRSCLKISYEQILVMAQYFPPLLVPLFYERFINCQGEDPLCLIPPLEVFSIPPLLLFFDCASSVLRAFLTTNRPLASLYLLCQCDTVCHHSNLLQPPSLHPPTPREQLFLYFRHNLQTVRQYTAAKVRCHIVVWVHFKMSEQTGAIIRFHQGRLSSGSAFIYF